MRRDALVVGINKYPRLKDTSGKAKHLKTPAGDAEAIAQLLEKYGEFEVRRLPAVKEDNKPQGFVKLEELKKAITDLFCPQGTQIPETAVLFFAGHGLRKYLGNKTEGFLVTSDVNPSKELWGVSLHWLREILQDSPVTQQIIWLDCCNSGELFNFAETDLAKDKKERDRCFIAASRDFQVAYEQAQGKHGVLSGALLQGLNPTVQSDKWITNFTLVDFVNKALKEEPQHPICKNFGGEITLTTTQSAISPIPPYKGLAYFDFNEEDPKYFYGRKLLTKQLVEKVCQSNFLAVLGASGSGKSSVVRAGLLHELKLGEMLPGSERWKIYEPFTPGEHPLESLERLIDVKADQLKALVKATPADRVVLVVDQLEEVFTLCRDEGERQQFFDCLLGAIEQLKNKFCLVLVMRADFQGKCSEQEYGGLAAKIDQNLVRVMPMSQDELEEAIIKPGDRVGLEIERELVNQIIEDVSGSPGDLPLMQYTLTKLWEQRTLGRLTINDYTRLGGVKEALEKHANEVYKSLSTEEKLIAKQIFLELTHLGEGTEDTRRQVFQEYLFIQRRSPELVEKVVQRLAEEKLVVTGEQEFEGKSVGVVNIAHEALIRNWDLLGKWLKENREALLRKQNIEEAAKDWRENRSQGGEAYLMQGTRLAAAEDYLQRYAETFPLTGLAQEFVQRSIKHRQRNRRNLVVTISAVFLGLSGLTGWALIEGADAQIRADSASSKSLFASDRKLESLVASLRAAKRLKNPLGAIGAKTDTRIQAVTALRQAVSGVTELNRFEGHEGAVYDLSISPDGKLIASAGKDGVRLWTIGGKLIKHFSTNEGEEKWKYDQVKSVSFSPDGKFIAFPNRQNIQLIDNSGKPLKAFKAQKSADETAWAQLGIMDVTFTPDGQLIASADAHEQVRLFTPEGILTKVLSEHKANWVDTIVFSPNSQIMASSDDNGVINIWNRNGRLLKSIQHIDLERTPNPEEKVVRGLSFSPDNKLIASAGGDGLIKLWTIDGKLLNMFSGHKGIVRSVSFSPNGQLIASASSDNTVKIWNKNGLEIATVSGHTGSVNKVSFTPDGQQIFTASDDGTIRIWSLQTTSISAEKSSNIKFIPNDVFEIDKKSDAEFSPDGKIVAVRNANKTVSLWSRDGRLINTLEQLNSISFSQDGKMIASTDDSNESINLWSTDGNLLKNISYSKIGYTDVKINPKKKIIASGSPLTLKLWDYNGKLISTLENNPILNFYGITFSPDGQIIGARTISNVRKTNGESTFKFWQINGQFITSIPGTKASISYNNKLIAALGEIGDGTIRIFNFDGRLIKNLIGHSKAVNDVQFSPHGGMVASASEDSTVKLWNTDGVLIETLEYTNPVNSLRFSPDGKSLMVVLNHGEISFLNLDLNNLLSQGCDWARNYLDNNKNISAEDRNICTGVKSMKLKR